MKFFRHNIKFPDDDESDVEEIWVCDIHGTTFPIGDSVCPSCQDEWHPLENEDA